MYEPKLRFSFREMQILREYNASHVALVLQGCKCFCFFPLWTLIYITVSDSRGIYRFSVYESLYMLNYRVRGHINKKKTNPYICFASFSTASFAPLLCPNQLPTMCWNQVHNLPFHTLPSHLTVNLSSKLATFDYVATSIFKDAGYKKTHVRVVKHAWPERK